MFDFATGYARWSHRVITYLLLLTDAYPPETMRRLRELKSRVDPDNVFRDNFNIAPPVLAGV